MLPNLKFICLNQNQLDDHGMIHLMKGKWPKINHLELSIIYFL